VWVRSILRPDLLELRRLVIGEAERFPELALTYYRGGLVNVERRLSERLQSLAESGLVTLANPEVAAQQFGFLIIGPLQTRAMFIPDQSPTPAEARDAIETGVAAFLALYGAHI
jgi:TetR/AcrR family transcriptional repressor of mexJK operon